MQIRTKNTSYGFPKIIIIDGLSEEDGRALWDLIGSFPHGILSKYEGADYGDMTGFFVDLGDTSNDNYETETIICIESMDERRKYAWHDAWQLIDMINPFTQEEAEGLVRMGDPCTDCSKCRMWAQASGCFLENVVSKARHTCENCGMLMLQFNNRHKCDKCGRHSIAVYEGEERVGYRLATDIEEESYRSSKEEEVGQSEIANN